MRHPAMSRVGMEDATGIWWVGLRDTVTCSTMHRTVPPQQMSTGTGLRNTLTWTLVRLAPETVT